RVQWDDSIGMYTYSYIDDQGFERTVYIENAGSMAHKLDIFQDYNVRDVMLQVHPAGDVDPNIWNVLLQFQNNGDMSATSNQLSVAYTVYDNGGNVVAQDVRPLDNPTMAFLPADTDAELRIEATILGASGQPVTAPQSIVYSASPVAAKAEAEAEAVAVSAAAVPSVTTGQIINVREGPGTVYNVLGQISPGESYAITGKNEPGDWWQIEFNGGKGWVIDQLVEADADFDAIALATDIPEPPEVVVAEAAPVPAADSGAAPAPAAPVIAAPPPSGAIPFGYGVQAHMVHTGDTMIQQVMASTAGMGFNWVKQQIEWRVMEGSPGNIDWGSMDPIVNAANGAGTNLLFSVVNAPAWARESGFDGSVGGPPADPQTYANFVGALAGKYCGSSVKMIEVWNEQNLHYEWGNKPLNAAEYVALLAPAYAAIKNACPSMWVVSGAPTPAGNNAPYAMDDFTYLEQMFQAGAANYMDAVGAHPSGYNVPPSVTWEGACEAIQKTGNSFNGACDSPHHSWSFR
ncbi:MAG: SH3 domain-containing protein, partial [Caldilineaceae bacterium]|nr:SH3 domain-containing protein [Caldilineaceae bacterium]